MRTVDVQNNGRTEYEFGRNLVEALLADGYAEIANHQIPPGLFKAMIAVAGRLFTPSLEPVLLAEMLGELFDNQCGYAPLDTEAYDGQKPEQKRMFTISRFAGVHPLYQRAYPDWWPSAIKDDRLIVMDGMMHMKSIVVSCLAQICKQIGVPISEFIDLMHDDDTILRILEYPEVPEGATDVMRANAHHDSGMLTLTWATGPGLMIQKPNGEWEDGSVTDGRLVLTVGLAFEKRLAYLATKYPSIRARLGDTLITARRHKVVAVPGQLGTRHAFALFFWPHPNQEIEPGLTAARHLYLEMSRHMKTVAQDPG